MVSFVVTFLVLLIGGLADATYLAYEHRKENKTLVCPLDHDCSVVTESKYSSFFGLRNEVAGLFYYVGLLVFTLAALVTGQMTAGFFTFILVGTALGLGFSVYLSALQIFVIKDYCFYCVISAAINLLLFFNALYLFIHKPLI